MSSGNDAIVGSNSLCRHFKFSTSSAKPNNIMQQIDRRADINSTNCNQNKLIFQKKKKIEFSATVRDKLRLSNWLPPRHSTHLIVRKTVRWFCLQQERHRYE